MRERTDKNSETSFTTTLFDTKLASGSDDGSIILWDVNTHQQIGEKIPGFALKGLPPPGYTGHTGAVASLAFSPDGTMLASGGLDNTIVLWDVENHQPVGEALEGGTGDLYSLAFSPDGTKLAAGSGDGTIMLWDLKRPRRI